MDNVVNYVHGCNSTVLIAGAVHAGFFAVSIEYCADVPVNLV